MIFPNTFRTAEIVLRRFIAHLKKESEVVAQSKGEEVDSTPFTPWEAETNLFARTQKREESGDL